jgi:hypothetical protein
MTWLMGTGGPPNCQAHAKTTGEDQNDFAARLLNGVVSLNSDAVDQSRGLG